jgi:hypothetical protein
MTRVSLNRRERAILQGVVGSAFEVMTDVDFERDVVERLDRDQLREAISSLRSAPELERMCCLRLESSSPSPEEWLLLAQSMDGDVSARAMAHLIASEPSRDALEYLVLAGSSTYKERAAEIILARTPPDVDLLRCVLARFTQGELAERAFRLLATLDPDVDMFTHVLKEIDDPSIAMAAWERVAALEPEQGDVSHILVFAKDRAVRDRAADHLLRSGLDDLDRLSYVLDNATTESLRDEAARRILSPRKKRKTKPKGEHLSSIVLRAREPGVIESAWTAFARLRFTKKDEWNLVHLRNILCKASSPQIRAQAFELARNAPFEDEDRAYIAAHATDAAVRDAFR